MLGRREFLHNLGLLGSTFLLGSARAAPPASTDLDVRELRLPGDPRIARRASLLVPRHLAPEAKVPLLVLLHGLGESGNEQLGIRAYPERYGLVTAYERLRRPPIARTLPRQAYFTEERLEEVNRELTKRPFAGVAMVCPVTPNPYRAADRARLFEKYLDWLVDTLLPAVREQAPIAEGQGALGLDGCSMGGYVAMELFLRRPELWGTLGTVQGAFGIAQARRYAERIAELKERITLPSIHLESSSRDPYLQATQAFSKRLGELGVIHELRIAPGPHDQPWLREVGTLEMLLWHERTLTSL